MANTQKEFKAKLPARISGVVFWALIFVGFITAVVVLDGAESKLNKTHLKNTQYLAYSIEEVLEQFPDDPAIETNSGRLRLVINSLRDVLGYTAVIISDGSKTLDSGMRSPQDDLYTQVIRYHPDYTDSLLEVMVSVYYPNEKSTISSLRKNILVIVGLSLCVFGLFLQKVLNKLISKPFLDMVKTAEKFGLGNDRVRFNEDRQDEFGYLGKFINEAIQKLFDQQDELNEALHRAEKSEAELRDEKEKAEVTLSSIRDAVIAVDVQGKIMYLNPSAESLLSINAGQARNRLFDDVVHLVNDDTKEPLQNLLKIFFSAGDDHEIPEHSSVLNGAAESIAVEVSISAMNGSDNEVIGAVIVIQDVSHTRKLTRQLSYQASHDMLTGLYNRRKFEEIIEEALIPLREDEEDNQHVFCYLDLDQFKIVNDTCGHVAGDELLKQVPGLFNQVFRSGDIVARLGGDEFGILLQNCSVDQASKLAEKIRNKINDFRFMWDDKTFDIGVSIGIVGIDKENADLTNIMSSADIACYAAKDAGRNRVHIYEASDHDVTLRHGQMHWTSRIQDALKNDRFRLYSQPIIDISSGKPEHYEILLRMLSENDDVIPPGAFLPAAERYNLMNTIDKWVISAVFNYISTHAAVAQDRDENKLISINLSGDSINDSQMLEFIFDEKEKFGINLKYICFEITETVAISNLVKATEFIKSLRAHGCRFSLDDFGSGLSSFAYLKNLPVDYLKIDGTFVQGVSFDKIDRAMVTSIHQVGDVMSLKTIAEKVENPETLAVLKEIGVDYVQGFYLGAPAPIDIYENT